MNERDVSPDDEAAIRLRGVRVHNLKNVNLDIPHGQLVCLCGLSGSGKTSLALDTLFAEGQRRYIECFSPYTRQFLEQWDKPDADRIDGIPPAVAITALRSSPSSRATVGSVTEAIEFLRLLFARVAELTCPECGIPVRQHSPQSVAEQLQSIDAAAAKSPQVRRLHIAFPVVGQSPGELKSRLGELQRGGFRRLITDDASVEIEAIAKHLPEKEFPQRLLVVVDRLTTGAASASRLTESIETAMRHGNGEVFVLVESSSTEAQVVDGRHFDLQVFRNRRVCSGCQREFPQPEPGLFSFNNPRGACPNCEGFGSIHFLDVDKIVPDSNKSVREGAIAPWNSPAYEHELEELISVAPHHDFPVDAPFRELEPRHVDLVWKGDRPREFGGLTGFFRWLERRKYKMHLRIFLARWRSCRDCPECKGNRLNSLALAWRINDRNIAELAALPIEALNSRVASGLSLNPARLEIAHDLLRQLRERLSYLIEVGVGYLSLDRPLRTLGGGERQRVALTRALGSSLVNLLYVLDEPSAGLHPRDVEQLVPQILKLNARPNTVVMVEHNADLIRASERVIEIGPAAGGSGGQIVFDGTPDALVQVSRTVTGQFLSGQRGFLIPEQRRDATRGSLRLKGARGNNLRAIDAEFPLGLLCVVTGVSGSGKSSLVRQTLAPAVQQALGSFGDTPLLFDELQGSELIDEVAVIDQYALGKISRSNPATYVKAFEEIRRVFSETADARARGLKPGHFSFNVPGGRCETCHGEGHLVIDMQFMADVLRRCDQCDGTRYQPVVREVRYRDRNITDVLNMTVEEAFGFFRGRKRIQTRLKLLIDAGLNYIQLGQPVSTMSSGETQRLRLAAFLGTSTSRHTLFIMDEPTAGLHPADVARLIESFNALIDIGHSLIVIEHHLLMMARADHMIDLGPGPAGDGGHVVAAGTPEAVAENPASVTGTYLGKVLRQNDGPPGTRVRKTGPQSSSTVET